MMSFFDNPFSKISSLFRSGVQGIYNFGFDVINASTQFNTYYRDKEKLAVVLSNPAMLKVMALQCDLFSMGEIGVDKSGTPIEDDPFYNLVHSPSPLPGASKSQFLWDFMFWNMLGSSYCYVDSRLVDRLGNKLYFLDPAKIEWPTELDLRKDKLIFSTAEEQALKKIEITYRYDDGTTFRFPFDRLVINFDLTNGVGNFYKGASRIDALYKIISNSEHVLDSDNINIRYSGKFLVGSPTEAGTTVKKGLSDNEKKDIEEKVDTMQKRVWALRSMVEIRRFVENMAQLQLGEKYLQTYFLIGNMYNIPRDVLEAYNSATYENQEKARAAHVNYTLDPKGNQFMNSFERHFGYRAQGKNISITWKHLPFMQVFEKERAETKKVKTETLKSLLAMGVPIKEANEFLELDFTINEKQNVQLQEEETAGPGSGQEDVEDDRSAEGEGDDQQTDSEQVTQEAA